MGTLQQRFEIERPLSAVYEALSRPDAIVQSLPGVTGVSRVAEDTYRLTVTSAEQTRTVDLTIVSRTPPRRLEWRAADGAWSGSVGLESVGPERTAVTISAAAADPAAESPSATALHDALQALKRALQASHVRVSSVSDASYARSGGRRYAAEWRDTARSAFTRPAEFPFALMRTISRQVDRVWGDVLRNTPVARLPQVVPGMPWNPDVEVCEQDDQVRVCIDVPGVDESHLHVEIDEGCLTVSGERQDERAREGGHRRSELHYGSFTRRIPLPDGVDPDSARAVLRNGVLEIRIPLHRRAPRRVPVQQVPQ